MRYEEVLQQAIDLLHEGINEGKITRGAVEDTDEHEGNCEQITWLVEGVVGEISDRDILILTEEMPQLLSREPNFDYGFTCPMGIMRENLYEILLDAIWNVFENEEVAK